MYTKTIALNSNFPEFKVTGSNYLNSKTMIKTALVSWPLVSSALQLGTIGCFQSHFFETPGLNGFIQELGAHSAILSVLAVQGIGSFLIADKYAQTLNNNDENISLSKGRIAYNTVKGTLAFWNILFLPPLINMIPYIKDVIACIPTFMKFNFYYFLYAPVWGLICVALEKACKTTAQPFLARWEKNTRDILLFNNSFLKLPSQLLKLIRANKHSSAEQISTGITKKIVSDMAKDVFVTFTYANILLSMLWEYGAIWLIPIIVCFLNTALGVASNREKSNE
ncbi:MAG: hypothetical protein PHV30_02650 [Candidatus Margulisbacteria bacterium]|nr:hypothetical protein [Candidatus Margulisiibacteriota bacterium]